jgi:hypothetical protein
LIKVNRGLEVLSDGINPLGQTTIAGETPTLQASQSPL